MILSIVDSINLSVDIRFNIVLIVFGVVGLVLIIVVIFLGVYISRKENRIV